MDWIRTLLGITLFSFSALSPALFAQESRTWTATSGHELVGTLVSYDKTNVKIQDVAGKIKSIPKVKPSPIDQNYILDFPDLKNNTKFTKGKLPRVDVRAIRSGSTNRLDINAEITISNRHKEDLEAEVVWIFYADPRGKGGILVSKPSDLIPVEPRMTSVTLKALDDTKFLTKDIRASRLKKGKDWEPTIKITGFIVQVYSGGHLLDGFASNGVLNDFSKDPDLLKKYRSK